MKIVTSQVMKELDRSTINDYGIPGSVLMERAGSGAFLFMLRYFKEAMAKGIAVVAGSGNNGGDGFVVARCAKERGFYVRVFLLTAPDKIKGDALENYRKIEGSVGVEILNESVDTPALIDRFKNYGCIVDAIFGTGFRGAVEGIYKKVIEAINSSGRRIIAIDIPSGLNPDTGEVMGVSVKADMTVTFGFPKIGQFLLSAPDYTGMLKVVDIGIPEELVAKKESAGETFTEYDVRKIIAPREFNAHKGRFGHLLIIAGSTGKTGAAVLASEGAIRTGAGLVTIAVPESLNHIFEVKTTEAMTIPVRDGAKGMFTMDSIKDVVNAMEGKDAVVLGPGIGQNRGTINFVKELLKKVRVPVVIDADGLNCLSNFPDVLRKMEVPVILTPHPGEMSRLSGLSVERIQKDRTSVAIEFAKRFNCILVLKGALSITASPDGRWTVNSSGNPGMATGGMGDVLSGIIGALLAMGIKPYDAVRCGVFIHGLAGDELAMEYGPWGFKAGEVADQIPVLWKKIFKEII